MLSPYIQRETLRLKRAWTPAERIARARTGRVRRARLETLLRGRSGESADVWATGSMTIADLHRVAS